MSAAEQPTIPSARLTVVEVVNHQTDDGPPTAAESRFHRLLTNVEQAWVRKFKVSETPKLLDQGWMKDNECAMLVLRNEEGRGQQVQPTAEEKANLAQRIMLVHCGGCNLPIASIYPGESLRLCPINVSDFMVSTNSPDGVKATLYLFPA